MNTCKHTVYFNYINHLKIKQICLYNSNFFTYFIDLISVNNAFIKMFSNNYICSFFLSVVFVTNFGIIFIYLPAKKM